MATGLACAIARSGAGETSMFIHGVVLSVNARDRVSDPCA